MKIMLALLSLMEVFLSLPCEARSYKANGGSCDMIAIRNTTDEFGGNVRKKGEILMMVGKERLPDGTVMVSEFRCRAFNVRDFKYCDAFRLP